MVWVALSGLLRLVIAIVVPTVVRRLALKLALLFTTVISVVRSVMSSGFAVPSNGPAIQLNSLNQNFKVR